MELEHVGAPCAACGLHDYTPFRCDGCDALFCKEHRPTGACTHGDASAPAPAPAASAAPRAFAHACSHCAQALAVRTVCPLCQRVVCLPHRDPAAHNCAGAGACAGGAGAPAPAPLRAITPLEGAAPAVAGGSGGGGEAAAALRAKVALTQLRMRAPVPAGVAASDRRFLHIAVDAAAGLAAAPRASAGICISQHASVARLQDAAVAAVGAPSSASEGLRLAVRRGATTEPLPLPADARLSDGAALASAGGALVDGDTVVLQKR